MERTASGLLEAWVSIAGNILLFAFKLAIGIATASISITADAFHTLSDVLSSVVVLFGFKMSSRGPDKRHPYGHGRMESIATLVISILLILTAFEFAKTSVERLTNPVQVGGGWWAAAIMAASAAVKEWMARFAFSLGEDIDSSALKADAWHHRSDAIASILVAVGNLAAVRGLFWVDPVLGLGVSVLIAYTGWSLARDSADVLLGTQPPSEVVEEIRSCARQVAGVLEVHGIKVHDYGYHREVSLHVEVDKGLDLLTAHNVADVVEQRLEERLGAKVVAHIDPSDEDEDR
jgi:cation diffusion facilitator family transporter